LLDIFDRLLQAYGPRQWWPGDSPLEVMVGAVLTQNTAWRNVEKAIANMKERGLMEMAALHAIGEGKLAEVIRPAGFYRVKAKRLKALIDHFCERHDGAVENTRRETTAALRAGLLSVKGIGPETADSILLYALDRPVFVVDAYTVRFLKHHGLYEGSDYHDVQRLFMESLPEDARLFNEFHALIVCLGQRHCKKKPECDGCPLADGKRRNPCLATQCKNK
jgi:endonuclease-3 related protein